MSGVRPGLSCLGELSSLLGFRLCAVQVARSPTRSPPVHHLSIVRTVRGRHVVAPEVRIIKWLTNPSLLAMQEHAVSAGLAVVHGEQALSHRVTRIILGEESIELHLVVGRRHLSLDEPTDLPVLQASLVAQAPAHDVESAVVGLAEQGYLRRRLLDSLGQ